MIGLFGLGFGWLSIQRHETYRTNAEDLGFTDQTIWNWLRGQAFRFSLYERAEFTTDIDLAALKRPDSFLAFHVEPMTALLAPIYLIRSDVRLMLLVQALVWSLGALPAYRIACRRLNSRLTGLAFASIYLLSPLGQWAVLSDLHTVLLAAPLLLWAVDLLDTERGLLFLLVGLLAMTAKEEVGLIVAALGLLACWRPIRASKAARSLRWASSAALVSGLGWSVLCVTVIIPRYAGTAVSPFTDRYAHLGATPGEIMLNLVSAPHLFGEALGRPEVFSYAVTLLLCGGWLALLAPEFLIPIAPSLALNVLSSSPWMASGRAHYSALILPLVVAGAIVGCQRLSSWAASSERGRFAVPAVLAALALLTTALAYQQSSGGPLSDDFVVPRRMQHHEIADRVIASIPLDARVSASSTIVPHLSQRTDVYLFPTVREADYVVLDVSATPFPVSAGDVHLRTMAMLGNGDWTLLQAQDGIVLLKREPSISQPLPDGFYSFARVVEKGDGTPIATYLDGALELVSGQLTSSGEVGPNGALGTLRTTWRTTRPVHHRVRPRLAIQFTNGIEQEYSDFAELWWYPPERWQPGELVSLKVAELPIRQVSGWRGVVPTTSDTQLPTSGDQARPLSLASDSRHQTSGDDTLDLPLGELTIQVRRSNWQLTILDPEGRLIWQEAGLEPGLRHGPLSFKLSDGSWGHLTQLREAVQGPGGVSLSVSTDDPAGRTGSLVLSPLGARSFRLQVSVSEPEQVVALGQAVASPSNERLLGFGERFTAVDQRGRMVTTWAEDRRVAGYGDSTYAPLPFFISSRGYSLLLETDVRSVFDLAAEHPDRYAWEAETSQLGLVFSYGPNARDLVQQQASRAGLPPLPPIWAFGVWKTAIGGLEQVLQDAARLRELSVPVSALYVYDAVDAESNIGWPYITFQGKRSGPYGDLRDMTDQLHARGFKALTYNTADFHVERSNYSFPAAHGLFLRNADGQPYVHSGFKVSWLDFSNPEAVGWWGLLWKRSLVELGFDGGMLDLGELTPEDARYFNGLDGRTMHNRYPVLYAQAAFESVTSLKPDSVLFNRSGGIGAQAFQHLQWPGDPLIDWSEINGFKSMLPAALSFGLSGFPYWHPEVGGYLATGLPRDSERELWFRWLQLGAFSSLLRDQYGDHQTGSPPVEMWSDEETIEAFRFYARLHNRLVPYLYSYARIASETGLPLMRHLALNYPEDARAWTEERQYTLGDELLVAPVLEEGARTRVVYLPAGQWVDFWSGAIFDGAREIVAEAPLDRIPVYARAGALLPMAADFDTLVSTVEPGVRTWTGGLVIKAMPSNGPASSTFSLYDGTQLTYRTDGARSDLRLEGSPGSRDLEIRLPVASAPGAVLVDGAPSPDWRHETASAEVVLSLHTGDVTISVYY